MNLPSLKFARRDAVQPCKKNHTTWSGDEQECLCERRNYKTVNTAEKEKKRLVQFSPSQLLLPGRFTLAEVNCQLAVSDFCCGVCYENYQVPSAR